MKTLATVAAAMVFMTAPMMQAQSTADDKYFPNPVVYKTANIPVALRAFYSCLTTDNEGVQESAMAHLTMLKLMMPSVAAEAITHRLEALSTDAPAPGTRFKAYIATQVYRNPELFANERDNNYRNGEELFNALAVRLQSTLLSYSGR